MATDMKVHGKTENGVEEICTTQTETSTMEDGKWTKKTVQDTSTLEIAYALVCGMQTPAMKEKYTMLTIIALQQGKA